MKVGDSVLICGTGSRWAGFKYRAVVADVRDSDATIKVHYADGGYKRFARADFEALVVHDVHVEARDEPHPEVVGRAAPTHAVEAALHRKEQLLRDAERAEARRARKCLQVERSALQKAVRDRDFLRAHDIDGRIRALEASGAEMPGVADVVHEATRRALGGGVAGAGAMAVQVTTMMWMRTTVYYQYRYGTGTMAALRALYAQGGVARFYSGYVPALFQGPLSRFGDTAANVGAMSLLNNVEETANLPSAVKTLVSASVASAWRIGLMPLDTLKTTLQVDGSSALAQLTSKIHKSGPTVLFHGSLGLAASAFLGHYSWFFVYNSLDAKLPVPTDLAPQLARNASLGFLASATTDALTNSIRVLKTYRQTSPVPVTYTDAATAIVKDEGVVGLLGRGLSTRLMANGVQAAVFSCIWKYLQKLTLPDR